MYNLIVHALMLALPFLALQAEATRPAFTEWLDEVRKEALSRGIRQDVVDEALGDIGEPLPVVLERDRAQAEIVLPLEHYLARLLTAKRIRTGREVFVQHKALLEEVGATYGVPARIIAAIWGVESNFGQFSGVRPTVAALATLAWDPRRSTFFRGELFDALEILNRGDIAFTSMKGSWAGAMGQVQFMPSSYLEFAEDYDGDGQKDIWSTPADVFASIANYLKGHGWASAEPWGHEVVVSEEAGHRIRADVARREGKCRATRDMTAALPMSDWQKLGVRLPGGRKLTSSDEKFSLVSGSTRHFLVSANYDALLEYNCAHSYALSVGLLSDAIVSSAQPVRTNTKKAAAARRKHKA